MSKTFAMLIAGVLAVAPLFAFADDRTPSTATSAAASKAGPTPQRDYINTPEAEQKALKQKGQ